MQSLTSTQRRTADPNARWQDHLISILLLVVVSGLAYLPLLGKLGYYNDDWYLMYAASAYGPDTFVDIFSVDRPGRTLVMVPAYQLFGDNPLYYNISAYLFRVAGAFALYSLLNVLWPGKRTSTTFMALLFLIYPAFLSQPNAIDYQSHMVGLAAAVFSILLTIQAVVAENRVLRWTLHSLSIPLGWFYLSQMEWYIGFEVFRWGCIFLLSARIDGTLIQKAWRSIQWGIPSLLIPIFFLTWRLFFFESQRGATDTDVQFELVRLYPIQTIFHWLVQVAQDLLDVLVSAWVIPLDQLKGQIQRWGGVLAFSTGALSLLLLNRMRAHENDDGHSNSRFLHDALLIGFVSAAAGLLPVAMANRDVGFPFFSRYSLVSSVGASIFLTALLSHVHGRLLRGALTAAMLVIAMLTHHANAVSHVQKTSVLQNFWWQVSWRVPQLQPRATLIASYPSVVIEEDYFVWGPANLIYYPEPQNVENIQPVLFASVLNKDAVTNVLARGRQKFDNRKNIITYPNYRNILVLSQPSAASCVHVIDGLQAEFSPFEADSIRVIGPYSEIEHVLAEEAPHVPPALVFGPEPEHGWCYYYQKADLARQRGDWEEVLRLGEEAFGKKLAPKDDIEWMPFLQAYASTGDIESLAKLLPKIGPNSYVAQQSCQVVGSTQDVSDAVLETVRSLYCPE